MLGRSSLGADEHKRIYVCSWHSLSLDAGILKCWDSDPSSGEDAKLLSSLTYFNLLNCSVLKSKNPSRELPIFE